ncbi:MAG: DoxX family protein [Cyanobacteria bacterium J06636_28]
MVWSVPLAGLVAIFTIAFQLLGGASLVVGYKARIGSGLLLAFLVPATLVFHNPIADPTQMIQFLKNLAIIGGLLMVIAHGAGPISLDNRLGSDNLVPRPEDSLQ